MEKHDPASGAPAAAAAGKKFVLPRIIAPALTFHGDGRGQQGGAIWMDNKAVNKCFECHVSFTIFNRKHHCRACGRIFCARCSSQRAMVNGVEGAQRVCDHCYNEAEREGGRDTWEKEAAGVSRISAQGSHGNMSAASAGPTVQAVGFGSDDEAAAAESAGQVEEVEASTSHIPHELATRYTYFRGGANTGSVRVDPQSPPASSRLENVRPDQRNVGAQRSEGRAAAWDWVLGGKSGTSGSSSAMSEVEEGMRKTEEGRAISQESGRLFRGDEGMEKHALARDRDAQEAEKSGEGKSVRDSIGWAIAEGPPGDIRGNESSYLQTEENLGRLGSPGKGGGDIGGDAEAVEARRKNSSDRLHAERLMSLYRPTPASSIPPPLSQCHFKALLEYLLESEGLDRSWRHVLQHLVTQAVSLLGHDGLASPAMSQASSKSASCAAASVPKTAPGDKRADDILSSIEYQSWLLTQPLGGNLGVTCEGLHSGGGVEAASGSGGHKGPVHVGGNGGPERAGKRSKDHLFSPAMDLQKFLKVKKVDGGKPGDSLCVRGLVFSNQVVHKKMALRIPPAGEGKGLTLLLLAGSVEYLRSNKYTSIASLSTLVTQDQEAGKLRGMVEEEEYLRVAVERILMQRPDLLLLEGFMGKAGLDLLRNAGVTVVMNVKHKVLEKLSMATGAPIAQGIQQLRPPTTSNHPQAKASHNLLDGGDKGAIGFGSHNRRQSLYGMYLPEASFAVLPLSTRAKPLICLDPGRVISPYVTVLLRGDGGVSNAVAGVSMGAQDGRVLSPLSKVKNVVTFAAYAAATICTEVAFLSDLRATIPSAAVRKPESEQAETSERIYRGDLGSLSSDRMESGQDCSVGEWEFQNAKKETQKGGDFWRLLDLSPWIAHQLPAEMSQNLSNLYSRFFASRQPPHPSPHTPYANACEESRSLSASRVEASGKGPDKKRVWGLSQAASLSVDSRKKNKCRLSRIREEEAIALSLPRPPRLGECVDGSRLKGQSAPEGLVQHSASQQSDGRCVWAIPGYSVDDNGAHGLRVLVSSTSTKQVCVTWSEMCFSFKDAARNLSLEDFLRRYCFEPTWTCPSHSCSCSQLEHTWYFLHETGKVRMRVSRSAPDSAAGGADQSGITVRTRCVSCARMTNPGSSLSKIGASVSFGRFLLMILAERQLKSIDDSCCHALHSQLLMFSIQQGAQALTALFIHEPITLTRVEIPSSRIQQVSLSINQRLLANELMQTFAATEALLTMASKLTKNNADHPWIVSGHVAKVFEIRVRLQKLSAGMSLIDSGYHSDSNLSSSNHSKPDLGANIHDSDASGTRGTAPGAGSDQGHSEKEYETALQGNDKALARRVQEDVETALQLKTQVLLITQSLFDDARMGSEALMSNSAAKRKEQANCHVALSCTSPGAPSYSVGERRQKDGEVEGGSQGGHGVLWCGPEDEYEGTGGVHMKRERASGRLFSDMPSSDQEAMLVEGGAGSGQKNPECETNETTKMRKDATKEEHPVRPIWPPWDEGVELSTDAANEDAHENRAKGDMKEEEAIPYSAGINQESLVGETGGVRGASEKDDSMKDDGEAKRKSTTLGSINGMAGGVGGVVGGLLQGVSGGGGLKDSSKDHRPSSFDSTILSGVVGRCCYVIPEAYLTDGCPLVVHEDEPASIIALALSSKGYQQALANCSKKSSEQGSMVDSSGGAGDVLAVDGGGECEVGNGGWAEIGDATESAGVNMDSPLKRASIKSKEVEEEQVKQESHVNVTFEADGACGPAELSCKVYFANSFHKLRMRYCATSVDSSNSGEDECERDKSGIQGMRDFISSLCRCKKWSPTGGRSGSAWLKTADDRFVLKEISRKEMAHFLQAAHEYFIFMNTTMDSSPAIPSCLAKILGLFKVTIALKRGTKSAGSQVILSRVLLLTENLLYNSEVEQQPFTRIFDLKGSSRNRFVKEAKLGDVQLDDNFHAYIQKYPLYLTEEAKRLLTVAIHNDTVFLTKINVMDYSLLVAVDDVSNRLIVGIIDYIRQYTMDKQAETYYKKVYDRMALGVLKGGGDGPTIVAPREYRDRFREAMTRNFVAAPGIFSLCRSDEVDRYHCDNDDTSSKFDGIEDKGVSDISSLLDDSQALKDHGLLEEESNQDWMDK